MTTQTINPRTISPAALLTPNEGTPLSAEDRLAIHELIARNYLVEDTRNEDHLAAIVTEDFKQEHVIFGKTDGRDGLAALLRDNPELFDGIRHQRHRTQYRRGRSLHHRHAGARNRRRAGSAAATAHRSRRRARPARQTEWSVAYSPPRL